MDAYRVTDSISPDKGADLEKAQYFAYSSNPDKALGSTAFNENSIDPTTFDLNGNENRTTVTDAHDTSTGNGTSTTDESTETQPATESDYSSYVIPLKIILPVEHVHRSSDDESFARYNFILLKVDDVAYHEHIASDNPDTLIPVHANKDSQMAVTIQSTTAFEDSTSTDSSDDVSTTDRTEMVPVPHAAETSILVDPQGYRYELDRHYKIADESDNVLIEFDDIKVAQTGEKERWIDFEPEQSSIGSDDEQYRAMSSDFLSAHYRKLYQWLTWE